MKRYHRRSKIHYFKTDEFEGRRKGTSLRDRIFGLEHLKDKIEGMSIVDVGCAEGLVLNEICSWAGTFGRGYDVQDNSIEYARKRFPDHDFQFFDLDCGHAPKYKSDVTLFLGVLHHLDEQVRYQVLDELIRNTEEYFCYRGTISLDKDHIASHNMELIHREPKNGITSPLFIYKRVQW